MRADIGQRIILQRRLAGFASVFHFKCHIDLPNCSCKLARDYSFASDKGQNFMIRLTLIFSALILAFAPLRAGAQDITPETAASFANLALSCVHQEYPGKISHSMEGDFDIRPPRELHPAFYGCYDWHSAVHGHWMLARVLRLYPDAPVSERIIRALDESFTMENIATEVGYFDHGERKSFERPYGYAWLLQLTMELREMSQQEGENQERSKAWLNTLLPLEDVITEKLESWLPNLSYPIRLGTHNQTAFAFGLILDWARQKNDEAMVALMIERIMTYYSRDVMCPLAYEPSGEDFLSPCLMEADLLRRVLNRDDYAGWLQAFLPQIPVDGSTGWLVPAFATDVTDGKIVHLDGLNLSRAWSLQGIASALPIDDPRRQSLLHSGAEHAASGLAAVTGEHYEGGHWLASFATYLVTWRGLSE
jgi:Protein of unknown function (DUF2891)